MTLAVDAIPTITAVAAPDGHELDMLRRAARSFHCRLAQTSAVVQELARHDLQFWDVARSLTAAMVTVELLIAVLGEDQTVAVALFDGPVPEPDSDDAWRGTANADDRPAWEQVWALRRSAINFSGRLNRCRFFAVPFGLTAAQRRVANTVLLAVGRMIETIGGLRIPDDFYELVR